MLLTSFGRRVRKPSKLHLYSLPLPVDLLIWTHGLSVKHLKAALCPPMKIKQLFVLLILLKYNPTYHFPCFSIQVSIVFFPKSGLHISISKTRHCPPSHPFSLFSVNAEMTLILGFLFSMLWYVRKFSGSLLGSLSDHPQALLHTGLNSPYKCGLTLNNTVVIMWETVSDFV